MTFSKVFDTSPAGRREAINKEPGSRSRVRVARAAAIPAVSTGTLVTGAGEHGPEGAESRPRSLLTASSGTGCCSVRSTGCAMTIAPTLTD